MRTFRSGSETPFWARSQERDVSTDNAAIKSIEDAIEDAIGGAEAEFSGLKRRLNDVLSRAAIAGGNDIDDYLTRAESDARTLGELDHQIRRGQERLIHLGQSISHFKFLKAVLKSRFPDAKT